MIKKYSECYFRTNISFHVH